MSAAAFEELGIMPELIKGVEELGWSLPTPVQADAVPLILGGGDVLAAAETGSGKTGAFALPVLQAVAEARAGVAASSALPAVANAGGGGGGRKKGENNGGGGGSSSSTATTTTTMSPTDRDLLLAVSADGLAAQSRSDRKWSGGRATAGVAVPVPEEEEGGEGEGEKEGAEAMEEEEEEGAGAAGPSPSSSSPSSLYYFFEATVRDEGLARVGWSLRSASLDLGTDAGGGVGYGGTGKLVCCGRFADFGEAFGRGDVVGCGLDPRRRRVVFYKNGKEMGGGGDAASAAAAADSSLELPRELLARAEGEEEGEGKEKGDEKKKRLVLFPTVSLKNAEVELNFGDRPFSFPPPQASTATATATPGTLFVPLAEAPPSSVLVRNDDVKAAAPAPAPAPAPASASASASSKQSSSNGKNDNNKNDVSNDNDKKRRKPLALILEPLKDLAEQTAGVFESIARYLPAPGVSTLLLVGGGGPPPAEAKAALRAGAVDVVVGTLGRVSSAVADGSLDLSGIRFLVLDEADRLVDALNADATFSLAAKVAQQRERAEEKQEGGEEGSAAAGGNGGSLGRLQTLFFSATLHSRRVEAAAARLCPRALRVDLKGAGFLPLGVDHLCVRVDPRDDASWLQRRPAVPTDRVHLGSRAAKMLNSSSSFSSSSGGSSSSSAAATAEAAAIVAGGGDSDPDVKKELLSLALKRLKARLLVCVVDAFRMPRAVVFCRTNFDCLQLARFLSSLRGEGGGGGGAIQDEALARAFQEEEAEEEEEEKGEEKGGKKEKKKGVGGGGGGKSKTSTTTTPASDFLFPSCPYSCAVLGGARTTDERRGALQAFKEGTVRFLVATDAAARGIDVAGLPYCVNFALPAPECSEDYVHRVGRVGRAGARGLAVSLVAARGVEEKAWFVTKKGYKPWEQAARLGLAADRKLVSEGGHATWLDESESLEAVCERLQGPMQELGPGLEMPEDVRERVEATAGLAAASAGVGGGGGGGGGRGVPSADAAAAPAAATAYGAAAGDEALHSASALAIKRRLEELAPAVKRLAELEEDAQTSFFELQERWSGKV